jgi:glycosyltransferase involved in cell wall biosynthesis
MKEWIQTRYPEIRHISVIPNASDNELAVKVVEEGLSPQRDGSKTLALYAGTLGLIDDCTQILRAAEILQKAGDENIEIKIIGDGNERDQIVAEADRLGLQNVEFLGRQTKETVMSWLTVADCALFICKDVPFLSTASPNKLFDAFAAGVPVLQTTPGWIRDLLEKEDCGLSVPPGDAAALAEALRRIARDKALRERLAANSKRVGLELYDRGLLAGRMREILRSVSEERTPTESSESSAPAPMSEQVSGRL